jgi:hypothetical protein
MKDSDSQTPDACYICFESSGILENVCDCTWMLVHRECQARWQLQKAGSSEETACRFCRKAVPDWREAHAGKPKAAPVMSVVYNGKVHQIRVQPGPIGQEKFRDEIRNIFNLSEEDTIELTFGCKIPGSREEEVTLEGWSSFDAAVHCAELNAGAKQEKRMQELCTPDRAVRRRKALPNSPSKALKRLFCASGGRWMGQQDSVEEGNKS